VCTKQQRKPKYLFISKQRIGKACIFKITAIQNEWSAVSSKVTLRARRSGGSGNAQKKRSARLYHRILTLERVDQKNPGITAIRGAFR